MKRFFIFATLLLVACENREEPVQFAIAAAPSYSFSANPNAASFAITGNISWQATLMNGGEWCSITPTAAHGDGTVGIFVAENADYMQERSATIVVKAGIFSKEITVKQAPPPCPEFDAGAIATDGQTICSGNAVNIITSSADASSENGNITYEWRRNGTAIEATNATIYNPSTYNTTIGAHTFTRWAKDGACATEWTQSAGQWILIVNGTPTITLSSGSASQTIVQNTAITPIIYAASDATDISLSGSLPAGVTGSASDLVYTISGTPSSSGTYGYTLTATNNNGCYSSASGTITVVTTPPIAYSTNIWIFGSQIWSDRIVATPSNCTQGRVVQWNDNLQSRYYSIYDGRYYYSWGCANNTATILCPSPWRIPTRTDFDELLKATNATALITAWGYGGYMGYNSIIAQFEEGALWSSYASAGEQRARALRYPGDKGDYLWVEGAVSCQVRCVR